MLRDGHPWVLPDDHLAWCTSRCAGGRRLPGMAITCEKNSPRDSLNSKQILPWAGLLSLKTGRYMDWRYKTRRWNITLAHRFIWVVPQRNLLLLCSAWAASHEPLRRNQWPWRWIPAAALMRALGFGHIDPVTILLARTNVKPGVPVGRTWEKQQHQTETTYRWMLRANVCWWWLRTNHQRQHFLQNHAEIQSNSRDTMDHVPEKKGHHSIKQPQQIMHLSIYIINEYAHTYGIIQ